MKRRIWGQPTHPRPPIARGILLSAFAGLCALLVLSACTAGARSGETSPRADLSRATVSSSSELTEQSQEVRIDIPFDRAVSLQGDAAADFCVTIDGEALNDKTTRVEAQAEGDVLHVRLVPAPDAQGVDTPLYFACYLGGLEIAAGDASGALGHVVGADGSAAIMESALKAKIPSGMKIEQVESGPGRAVVAVRQFAQIRCCTWFSVGDETLFMHHHRFAQESNATCAAAMAEAIQNGSGGRFSATAEGDEVTVSAADGSSDDIEVHILEGVGR